MSRLVFPLLLTPVFFLSSCANGVEKIASNDPPTQHVVRIDPQELDSGDEMKALLRPYRKEVQKWEAEIGESAVEMPIETRSRELGSWVSDAIRLEGSRQFDREIDAAFYNAGGLRATLPEGTITYRKIAEILPFENTIYLFELDAGQMETLVDRFAESRGRTPISNMTITASEAGELKTVLVNGESLVSGRQYTVATNSFIGSGEGGFGFLEDFEVEDTGVLARDLVADYVRTLTREGKQITLPERVDRYEIEGSGGEN